MKDLGIAIGDAVFVSLVEDDEPSSKLKVIYSSGHVLTLTDFLCKLRWNCLAFECLPYYACVLCLRILRLTIRKEVQVDTNARENFGVGLGDNVVVRKLGNDVPIYEATKVVVAPESHQESLSNEETEKEKELVNMFVSAHLGTNI